MCFLQIKLLTNIKKDYFKIKLFIPKIKERDAMKRKLYYTLLALSGILISLPQSAMAAEPEKDPKSAKLLQEEIQAKQEALNQDWESILFTMKGASRREVKQAYALFMRDNFEKFIEVEELILTEMERAARGNQAATDRFDSYRKQIGVDEKSRDDLTKSERAQLMLSQRLIGLEESVKNLGSDSEGAQE